MEMNQPKDNEIQINVREIFFALLSKMGVILLSGVLLAVLAVTGTKLFMTPQYQSVTKMYVLSKQDNATLTSMDMQTSTLLTKDYAELILSRTVTEAVIGKLDLDLKPEQLASKVEIGNTTDTRIVTIKVTDADPYQARDIANTLRDTAAEHIKNVMNIEAVNVVDEANIPDSPVGPSAMKNGMIAGILGCIIAVMIVIIRYLTNDTIQTAEDVERYLDLSTLGTLPLEKNEKKGKKRRIRNNKRR